MSARIVAVTALLLDVLDDLAPYEDCTPSETALANLLLQHGLHLRRIKDMATAEMQALAPALLAATEPTETLAHPASQPAL